ncbi:MAG: hypothetical protein GXP59_01155 [Deltaproteobacteria bacterium]|nr:hypothetical protein [Deltaproteobacteria bacterium]
MPEFVKSIGGWVNHTQVLAQIRAVDAGGLFHNPYFLVPFICLIIYYLYKQAISNLIITTIGVGLWYFSGTDYVKSAVIDGIVQIDHIIPIAGVGIAGLAVLIYLVFIRQD